MLFLEPIVSDLFRREVIYESMKSIGFLKVIYILNTDIWLRLSNMFDIVVYSIAVSLLSISFHLLSNLLAIT